MLRKALHRRPTFLSNFMAALVSDIKTFLSGSQKTSDKYKLQSEVLTSNDLHLIHPGMLKAKSEERKFIIYIKSFAIVIFRKDIPSDAKSFPGIFTFEIKSIQDGYKTFKARFVLGGNQYEMKKLMVHSHKTLLPFSLRLIISIPVAYKLDMWTSESSKHTANLGNYSEVAYKSEINPLSSISVKKNVLKF